jgi:phosphatidylserine synthase 2
MGGISLLSVLILVYRWYHVNGEADPASNIKLGIFAALWSFVVFGMMHFPDGIMVRPHPIVWRAVMALMVIYFLTVVFFLFQDYKTTRKIIGMYDPKSLIEEPDRSWAEDCRMSTPEKPYLLFETIFDEFLLAHLLGYMGKMIVLRDWKMVMFISFGFEVVEFSLQHVLPNFAECWWDHVIADIIVCNAGGAFLGWLILKAVGAKPYEFVALSDIRTLPGKAKRVALQLVPRSLDRFQWEFFDNFQRFAQVMGLLFVMLLGEINSFTTKLMWNLPPTNHLVLFRLVTYGASAIPGIREYYEWTSSGSKEPTRIGPMAWLIIVTFCLETVWSLKMAYESDHRYFKVQTPAHIALPWIAVVILFVFWVAAFFSTKKYRQSKGFGPWLWRGIISAVLYLILTIILGMCLMAGPDLRFFRAEFDTWAAETGLWK